MWIETLRGFWTSTPGQHEGTSMEGSLERILQASSNLHAPGNPARNARTKKRTTPHSVHFQTKQQGKLHAITDHEDPAADNTCSHAAQGFPRHSSGRFGCLSTWVSSRSLYVLGAISRIAWNMVEKKSLHNLMISISASHPLRTLGTESKSTTLADESRCAEP